MGELLVTLNDFVRQIHDRFTFKLVYGHTQLTLSPRVATAVDYGAGCGRRLPSTTTLNAAGDRCRQLFFFIQNNHYIIVYILHDKHENQYTLI